MITLAGSQIDYLRPASIAIGVTLMLIGIGLAVRRSILRSRGDKR